MQYTVRVIISGSVRNERQVAGMGENRNTHGNLIGEPKDKTLLGRPRRRRDGLDWIDLAEDRDSLRALVNAVLNRRDP